MASRCLTVAAAVAVVACLAGLAAAPTAGAARPFETAVFDHLEFPGPDRDRAFAHVRAAGATTVRIGVAWSEVAPAGTTKPANFDARDPLDPAYDFRSIDKQVVAATQAGLRPYLMIFAAPEWAERGTVGMGGSRNPDPREFGDFAKAIAERYSGSTLGLPAVRYWQAWNEPNLHAFLMPQFTTPYDQTVSSPFELRSPDLYRALLRHFARAVRSVDPGNRVITGGLLPFGRTYKFRHAVWPLMFMRELLCLTSENKPKPGCRPVPFDIWAHHPYTEGGPNHKASVEGNASMGDLPAMRRILDAAVRAGHVDSRGPVGFWITEFSWETKPADDEGVPMRLHARWLAEAFYRMWQQRISLVTWFKIRDETTVRADGYRLESGLYFNCPHRPSGCYRPKRSLTAFQFPFVAFKHGRGVRFWGRTPAGVRARVAIEQRRANGRWRELKRLRTDRYGILRGDVRRAGPGPVRGRMLEPERERSLPFELKPTPDLGIRIFGEVRK
jgi:hypothetical protein